MYKVYCGKIFVGKQIIAVVNFKPKQVANFLSEVLILGISENNKDVILLVPEKTVPNGLKMS